jgi:formate dehydrogenase iron-sulfur subunit
MVEEPRALLVDLTRCIGCGACVEACLDIHDFDGDPYELSELSARAYTVLHDKGDDLYVRQLCMHCESPSCVSVCPVGALQKTADGPVVYDADVCMGCRYCIQACPFDLPRYEWDKPVPAVGKCDLCADRQAKGELPACAAACPAEATTSGRRADLIKEAHRRIDADPAAYFPHVYGEREAGGTSVMFLSPVDFAVLGFKQGLGTDPLPLLTQQALERVPGIVIVGGSLLMAIHWITRRRQEVARVEAVQALPEKQEPESRRTEEASHGTH